MEAKKHTINTIDDVLEVVNENNIESFLSDFRDYIKMTWNMQELFNSLAEIENIPIESVRLNSKFHWIDDGKSEHKIIISTKA